MLTYLVLQSYGSDKMSTLPQEKERTKVNLFSVVVHVKGPSETHLRCSIYNINLLLCGLDCSLWKSPDPKFNVHTEVFLSPRLILLIQSRRNTGTKTLNIQNNCCLKQSCELLIKHQTHKVTQRAFVARSTSWEQWNKQSPITDNYRKLQHTDYHWQSQPMCRLLTGNRIYWSFNTLLNLCWWDLSNTVFRLYETLMISTFLNSDSPIT